MNEKQHKKISDLFTEKNTQKLVINVFFIMLIAVAAVWVYSGMDISSEGSLKKKEETPQKSVLTEAPSMSITNRDQAVAEFLNAAQILARVYHFTNGNSYQGLCEASVDQYTLEGESGGILKYIKFVGATEVFCSTSDTSYLIEAKQPDSGLFYCIDSTGASVLQKASKEGKSGCSS